ncbi:MAG: DegT/DnrJ/EryC1/StrS aminotransferase family protein [Deltaproteobacteria bacterium]|nr:DegT/DnrJ/EryC1/StrS aminotransferase family protein [Deltaproteobacteria bacterium]
MIPLCRPSLDQKELKAIEEVLNSGWLTEGPKNEEFEKNFAKYVGVSHAISLNSCTSALQLALEAYSITGEVLLPSFTFVASANAIVKAGATPVFVDIDERTCNVDPQKIVEKITSKTQAIMPVHFGGQSCDMASIMQIAQQFRLCVIEDSAETIGGEYHGKKVGSFGVGCFSFFPTKNMTTGEGGMLTTHDEDFAKRVRTLAGHGIEKTAHKRNADKHPWERDALMAGYNYRLSNILAAIGVEQLKKLDFMNQLRREHASYLNEHLHFDEVDRPYEDPSCKHVYQMYTLKVKGVDRTQFVQKLREYGVGASVHFDPPVHLQSYYRQRYPIPSVHLPVTEKVARQIVTLPLYPSLTNSDLKNIVHSVEKTILQLKEI